MEVNRRTQADRTAATRAALIGAARTLFAEQGFGAVGTQAIAAEAGVTRGALYHQFADKTDLFRAVFEEIEEEVMGQIGQSVAAVAIDDPLEAMRIGARVWLELCADPRVHRIALLEAPSVLGWKVWREANQRHGLGMIQSLVQQAIDTGAIPDQPVRPLSHGLIGAIDEGAMYVALAEDPAAALDEMVEVTRKLIEAITIE